MSRIGSVPAGDGERSGEIQSVAETWRRHLRVRVARQEREHGRDGRNQEVRNVANEFRVV